MGAYDVDQARVRTKRRARVEDVGDEGECLLVGLQGAGEVVDVIELDGLLGLAEGGLEDQLGGRGGLLSMGGFQVTVARVKGGSRHQGDTDH